MSPALLHFLLALGITALTFVVGYGLDVGGRRIDALDAALLVLALVNLRLGWTAARGAQGWTPLAYTLAGAVLAGAVTWAMVRALTPG